MSSSDLAISVRGLSKSYTIRHNEQRHTTLSEALMDRLKHPFRASPKETFWALQDVSFDIRKGEIVGIIGRNGAGKSTLLKVLSRITKPTRGEIDLYGRVVSLLEVGTGFHQELTGRENIFLNGAILGMTRASIKRKFDEIVAFAEVEKFLDTPVKRYSSGMYVRLAFAVAAHLDTDILIIDEVLAVGDADFQKKCIGKMQEVSHDGRTVLFVSHQTGAVAGLCNRAVLLAHGKVVMIGSSRNVIGHYLGQFSNDLGVVFERSAREATKDIAILRAQTSNEKGETCSLFTHEEAITVSILCKVNSWLSGAEIRFVVRDFGGRTVFTTDAPLSVLGNNLGKGLVFQADARIPGNFLRPQRYVLTFATFIPDLVIVDLVPDALAVTIADGGSKYAKSEGLDYGCVFANCVWTLRQTTPSEALAFAFH